MVTVFCAGIGIESTEATAAKALIDFLQSPDAIAVLRKKGLDPDAA